MDPLVIAIAALVVAGALGLLLSGAHRHLPLWARRILVSERRLGLRRRELRRRAQVLSDAEREFFSINGRYGEQTDLMAVLTTPELTAEYYRNPPIRLGAREHSFRWQQRVRLISGDMINVEVSGSPAGKVTIAIETR